MRTARGRPGSSHPYRRRRADANGVSAIFCANRSETRLSAQVCIAPSSPERAPNGTVIKPMSWEYSSMRRPCDLCSID